MTLRFLYQGGNNKEHIEAIHMDSRKMRIMEVEVPAIGVPRTRSRWYRVLPLIIIVLLILIIVYIAMGGLRHLFVHNRARITEEAATTGMNEAISVLEKAPDWSLENLKSETAKLPGVMELKSERQTLIYTKNTGKNDSFYDAKIELNNKTATVTSSGYIKNDGKQEWKKTIESFFCQETYKYALLALGKPDSGEKSIEIVCSQIFDGDMATLKKEAVISIDRLKLDPGRKKIILFGLNSSHLEITGTSSDMVDVVRVSSDALAPQEATFPPFPPDSELTFAEIKRGMFETEVGPGKYKKLEFSEALGDASVMFKPGTYYIGEFLFEKDYQPRKDHKEINLKFLSGTYCFFIKDLNIHRANIMMPEESSAAFYVYDRCELRNMRFNEKGRAEQVMIYVAGDHRKNRKSLMHEIIGTFIFSDFGGTVAVEYSIIRGSIIGNSIELKFVQMIYPKSLYNMKKVLKKATKQD